MSRLYASFLFAGIQLIINTATAQQHLLRMWDKTYGGINDDIPVCFLQARDSGYLVGGYSYSSPGGNKTASLKNAPGLPDFWIVKTDTSGNIVWDKDFGGTNGDQLNAMVQTSDGGYMLGGMSASDVGGDKTQPLWGNWDYWILKLDSLGNIIWDKDFGGIGSDQLTTILQTKDGGYILGGNSASDVSGNKSEAARGATDFWIVKTDSFGNKMWDKTFGGADADQLYAVVQTDDGGFILGGSSWSGITGDKTESGWGFEDYWVVRIDSLGNKLWDKDFGGTGSDDLYSIVPASDGGFILGGKSSSGVSGNKSEPLWGGFDYWIIKIDSAGNKLSERNIGGTADEDEFGNIAVAKDGGFLVAGTSYSPPGGDKTESNVGAEQSWFVKTDSLLNKQWDKTVFTACHDEMGKVLETSDQCYLVLGVNGPLCTAGSYRTQDCFNNSRDYWIVKLCDSTSVFPGASTSAVTHLCPGTCTSFINLSINSSSFAWSFPGGTPAASTLADPGSICYAHAGTYDVTLITGNYYTTDTLTLNNFITVYDEPVPQAIRQSDDTLYAAPQQGTYQWYAGGIVINGATDNFYFPPVAGDYSVVATDTNGCEAEAAIFNVMTSVNKNINSQRGITVFPSPASDKITVAINGLHEPACEVSVYNMLGEKVFASAGSAITGSKLEMSIDVRRFAAGAYCVEAMTGNGTLKATFVKQ